MSPDASAGDRRRPVVIAHRGASAARPENTVAAFVEARRLGADGVELDVHLSADGVLMVHHDPRLSDGRAIADTDRADVPNVVPTLDEALDACAGIAVNVEVKHRRGDRDRDVARAVVERLVERDQGSRDRSDAGRRFGGLLISSFDRQSIDLVHRLEPALPTAALAFRLVRVERWLAQVAAAGHTAVNPWDRLVTADLVARAHAERLDVNVWTVDEPDRMRELADLGVDGIITNVPGVARSALDAD